MNVLFYVVLIITFLRAYMFKLVSIVFTLLKENNVRELRDKYAMEIQVMTKELNQISMTDEWAKYAKLQRRITKEKNNLNELKKDSASKKEAATASVMKVINWILYGCIFLVMYYGRTEVVAQVPETWLVWPFSWLLFWTSSVPGGITAPCWMIISSRAAQLLAAEM